MVGATNTPYVKVFETDDDGNKVLTNPIENGLYQNDGSNRKNRRLSRPRFKSNKKGVSLVTHTGLRVSEEGRLELISHKYKRVLQVIANPRINIAEEDKESEFITLQKPRVIEHLVPVH